MNLSLLDSSVAGDLAVEQLRLSERSSNSRSSGRHHLDAASSDMEDSFLVSDDEGEHEESRHQRHSTQSMAKDDYSPIPVRNLQRFHHGASSKRNMVKKTLKNPLNESESLKILLPHKGQTSKPQMTTLGLALQPRNTRRFVSSNLQDQSHATKNSSQTHPQPQNLAENYQQQHRPTFPHLATTVATAIATATSIDAHNLPSSSSSKRVTFSHTSAANQDTMMDTHSRSRSRYTCRMRTRSQAIAITKNNHVNGANYAQVYASVEDQVEDGTSYNEQLYDNATWRMYHRIVEHRQNQQRHQREASSSTSEASSQDSSHAVSYSSGNPQLLPQGYACSQRYPPSASSSVASSMEDDDEGIFEMEL